MGEPQRTRKRDTLPQHPRMVSRLLCSALAVIGAIGMTGCSDPQPRYADPQAVPDGYLGGSAMEQEYEATIDAFPYALPEGYEFPASLPDDMLAGVGEGSGVPQSQAYFYWLCAWEADYLRAFDARDGEAQSAAIAMIEKFPETSFAQKYFEDPDNAWYQNVVATAKLGDPTGVRNDLVGCAGFGITAP